MAFLDGDGLSHAWKLAKKCFLGRDKQAADSAKLGGRAPEYYVQPKNLLDNSDFTDLINQRGSATYSNAGYAIDRWLLLNTNGILTVKNDCLHIKSQSGDNVYLFQRIDAAAIKPGGVYTMALKHADGTLDYLTATMYPDMQVEAAYQKDTNGAQFAVQLLYSSTSGCYEAYIIETGNMTGVDLEWVALYEGSYTDKTLPPYRPKGYAAEMAECQRYFQRFDKDGWDIAARCLGDAAWIVPLAARYPMRVPYPSISGAMQVFTSEGWTPNIVPSIQITVSGYTVRLSVPSGHTTADGNVYLAKGTIDLIADL